MSVYTLVIRFHGCTQTKGRPIHTKKMQAIMRISRQVQKDLAQDGFWPFRFATRVVMHEKNPHLYAVEFYRHRHEQNPGTKDVKWSDPDKIVHCMLEQGDEGIRYSSTVV